MLTTYVGLDVLLDSVPQLGAVVALGALPDCLPCIINNLIS